MKKIVVTLVLILLSVTFVQAQKKDKKEDVKKDIYVKLKDGKKPLIYVDGKKFDFPMELIDQSKIESVFVLKGKEAVKKYNAPDGVVLIKTKGAIDFNVYSKVSKDSKVFSGKKSPIIIVDGKVVNEKTFKKYNTKNIESIEIIKGEQAMKRYNAPNGVVLVKTKKKH